MKTDPTAPLLSDLSDAYGDYREHLGDLLFEWGLPQSAAASGAFEIRLHYEVYDVVHTVSLAENQVAILSFLRFGNGETQVIRRNFGPLGRRDSES